MKTRREAFGQRAWASWQFLLIACCVATVSDCFLHVRMEALRIDILQASCARAVELGAILLVLAFQIFHDDLDLGIGNGLFAAHVIGMAVA